MEDLLDKIDYTASRFVVVKDNSKQETVLVDHKIVLFFIAASSAERTGEKRFLNLWNFDNVRLSLVVVGCRRLPKCGKAFAPDNEQMRRTIVNWNDLLFEGCIFLVKPAHFHCLLVAAIKPVPQRIEQGVSEPRGELHADRRSFNGLLKVEDWREPNPGKAQSLREQFELPIDGGDHNHFGFIINCNVLPCLKRDVPQTGLLSPLSTSYWLLKA